MKINFRKMLSIGLVSLAIFGGAIVLGINQAKSVEASTLAPAIVENVQPNQVVRDGWNFNVIRTTLSDLPNDATQRLASVTIALTNSNGAGEAFTPAGKLIGIVGSSGKEYDYTLDSLDKIYAKTQKTVQIAAQKEGITFEPGNYKITAKIYVDPSEQSITKVIYEDENGNKLEVPITIVTEILENNGFPGGK